MLTQRFAIADRRPETGRLGGFTLIEMMVAISLLGILVMLAVPAFTSWIRNSQVRTAAEALQGSLRVAQAESLRRNRQVVMSFTTSVPIAASAPAVAGGKNFALQTVAQFGENAEFITGGSLADTASKVSISNVSNSSPYALAPSPVSAVCFNSAGRLMANSGATGAACTAPTSALTFKVALSPQATDDRPLIVALQLGGQVRMCDPARPALSSTSPDGCP